MVRIGKLQPLIKGAQREVSFETAAIAADASAPAGLYDHVTDLARVVGAASIEMAGEDETGAESRADEEIDKAVQAPGDAMQALADGRGRGVVLDDGRESRRALQLRGKRKILPSR